MSADLDIEIERRTAAGHEALLADMAIPDPEMSVLAQKAAMFDELVEALESALDIIGAGRYPSHFKQIDGVLQIARNIK